MSRPNRSPYLAATLAIVVMACDSPTDPVLLPLPPVVLEAVGDSKQLEAATRGSDQLPIWESLNPEIVTVTRAGMATAVAAGTATVRARLGSETREGQVTVLPPIRVEITSASAQPGAGGMTGVTLRVRNSGGRGYYRMRFYRASATPGGDPQIVLQDFTDREMAALQPEITETMETPEVSWLVVYSREPHSISYHTTACVRLDGPGVCPMP